MLGAGLQLTRGRGEDLFCNPAKARSSHQNRQNDQLLRPQSDVAVRQSLSLKEKPAAGPVREPENRTVAEELPKPVAFPSSEPVATVAEELPKPVALPSTGPVASPLSNLERFLESITPSVPSRYLSKTTMRDWRTYDVEFQPYFVLGDLWESFKEWSAYGAGVPLILNDSDSVVQYYVPYLSGIQIYRDSSKSLPESRRPGEDSDIKFRDSNSDGSGYCEPERGYSRELRNNHHVTTNIPLGMDRLSLRGQHTALQDGFSSDEGESVDSHSDLIFEYLERDHPYSREPLADKILNLSARFPELKTLRSCDLLLSSWISVAWYPIYRISTGPTLKELDACFLTYHSLGPQVGGVQSVHKSVKMDCSEMDGVPNIRLPVFGLASYKFRGALWTANGGCEHPLASSLLQAADSWLRLYRVDHPDFLFFTRR